MKRVERLNIDNAMKQAEGECGDKPPLVAHRKNGGPWMVTMLAPTFFNLIEQCQQNKTVTTNTSELQSQERS